MLWGDPAMHSENHQGDRNTWMAVARVGHDISERMRRERWYDVTIDIETIHVIYRLDYTEIMVNEEYLEYPGEALADVLHWEARILARLAIRMRWTYGLGDEAMEYLTSIGYTEQDLANLREGNYKGCFRGGTHGVERFTTLPFDYAGEAKFRRILDETSQQCDEARLRPIQERLNYDRPFEDGIAAMMFLGVTASDIRKIRSGEYTGVTPRRMEEVAAWARMDNVELYNLGLFEEWDETFVWDKRLDEIQRLTNEYARWRAQEGRFLDGARFRDREELQQLDPMELWPGITMQPRDPVIWGDGQAVRLLRSVAKMGDDTIKERDRAEAARAVRRHRSYINATLSMCGIIQQDDDALLEIIPATDEIDIMVYDWRDEDVRKRILEDATVKSNEADTVATGTTSQPVQEAPSTAESEGPRKD